MEISVPVEASNPRVELSHAHTVPDVTIISAIETRFRSPPETPARRVSAARTKFLGETPELNAALGTCI